MIGTAEVQPIGQVRPNIFRPVTIRFSAPLDFSRHADRADDPRVLRQITAEVMDALPELRAVGRYGVGVDSVDVAAAAARHLRTALAPCLAAPPTDPTEPDDDASAVVDAVEVRSEHDDVLVAAFGGLGDDVEGLDLLAVVVDQTDRQDCGFTDLVGVLRTLYCNLKDFQITHCCAPHWWAGEVSVPRRASPVC